MQIERVSISSADSDQWGVSVRWVNQYIPEGRIPGCNALDARWPFLRMEDVLPVLCNCDHLAMQAIHAALIREGTCVTADRCDYCIVGDESPIAEVYELVKAENSLLLSVKKEAR